MHTHTVRGLVGKMWPVFHFMWGLRRVPGSVSVQIAQGCCPGHGDALITAPDIWRIKSTSWSFFFSFPGLFLKPERKARIRALCFLPAKASHLFRGICESVLNGILTRQRAPEDVCAPTVLPNICYKMEREERKASKGQRERPRRAEWKRPLLSSLRTLFFSDPRGKCVAHSFKYKRL